MRSFGKLCLLESKMCNMHVGNTVMRVSGLKLGLICGLSIWLYLGARDQNSLPQTGFIFTLV